MRKFVVVFLMALSVAGYAQDTASAEELEEVGDVAPDFPGGMEAFFTYIRDHKNYPEEAEQNQVKGKVFVSFIIDATGRVEEESVAVIKGLGYGCDQEAIRLIKNSPRWTPGRISETNKKVPTRMVLPIVFGQ